MARFVRFSPCPKCGSRDNLGIYDDGSGWCFGCHYYQKPSAEKFVPPKEGDIYRRPDGGDVSAHGRDLSGLLPAEGVNKLLERTGLTIPELLRANAGSTGPDTLGFVYTTADGTPTCLQVRNYGSQREGAPKYFNRGSTEYAFPLYHRHPDDKRLVITEDTLSALKVARVTNSFSALGTHVQTHKLLLLRSRGFQRVFVWLDKDKWREGREICEKAQWIGMSATAIITDEDPKYYSEEEILRHLV